MLATFKNLRMTHRGKLIDSSCGPAFQETEALKKALNTTNLQQPHAVHDLKDETLVAMEGDILEFFVWRPLSTMLKSAVDMTMVSWPSW